VKCTCTTDDLVCDYGYERNSNGHCKRNDKQLMFCKAGEEEKETASKGYRRVPGDVCESKDATEDHIKLIDMEKKCTETEKEQSREADLGIITQERARLKKLKDDKLLQEELTREVQSMNKLAQPKKKKSMSAMAVIVIVMVVLAVIVAAGFYTRRYINSRDSGVRYVRSSLDGKGSKRSRSEAPFSDYKDESDMDDETLLPV